MIWSSNIGITIVKQKPPSDPSLCVGMQLYVGKFYVGYGLYKFHDIKGTMEHNQGFYNDFLMELYHGLEKGEYSIS